MYHPDTNSSTPIVKGGIVFTNTSGRGASNIQGLGVFNGQQHVPSVGRGNGGFAMRSITTPVHRRSGLPLPGQPHGENMRAFSLDPFQNDQNGREASVTGQSCCEYGRDNKNC